MAYYDAAQKAVEHGDMTWAKVREVGSTLSRHIHMCSLARAQSTNDEWYALSQQKVSFGVN